MVLDIYYLLMCCVFFFFFFSSRRRHTRCSRDWSSDVCSSDLLYEVSAPARLTIIVNTGDDIELHGLKISPDLDIVTYTLAGIVDPAKGWGIRNETFHALKRLAAYGRANWFNLGDCDLATHIHRTALLEEGKTLSDAAESIRGTLGVKARILPMSDDPVPT